MTALRSYRDVLSTGPKDAHDKPVFPLPYMPGQRFHPTTKTGERM